ncbi:hypothetical protein SAMN06296386_109122 [Lachnospiraceae bacterium]|nr:hypothetical protein SAMN06296386_109122 [Lachnospiraceae bacterium]
MVKSMSMSKKIKVYKAINTVLHRITMKREFALIAKAEELDQCNGDNLNHIYLIDQSGAKYLLYVGDKVYSRESFDKNTCLSKILEKYPDLEEDDVFFPTINDLYKIAEDKTLEIPFIIKERRDQLNRKWINDYLQIGTNEGEWYMTDDFSAINIQLQEIGDKKEGSITATTDSVTDPAKFEIYDRLMKILYDSGAEEHYGDAFCIEYSIIYARQEYRYYLMYFFSNHSWNADPSNILNVCVTTTIVPGIFDSKDVRFTHPSKKTYCKEDGKEYLMVLMTMDNDVSVKFVSVGKDKSEKQTDGDVAGNRVYDNLMDFSVWLSAFHQEIRMA